MHARHRSPGHGYRPSPMGIGMTGSRISPDTSIRGGAFNSDHWSYGRGFGRGRPKPFQSPQPQPALPSPSPRGDLFVEAGRLAAEYLVSQGLLPQDVLSSKSQEGSSKRTPVDFQGGENFNPAIEGRLGNFSPDDVSGRRRSPNDYGPMSVRNFIREKRGFGTVRSYSSDWSRENVSGGASWADKGSVCVDLESDNDTVSARRDPKEADCDPHNPHVSELTPKVDSVPDTKEAERHPYALETDTGINSFASTGSPSVKTSEEVLEGSDGLNVEYKEIVNDTNDGPLKKQAYTEELGNQLTETQSGNNSKKDSDLLNLCTHATIPTSTHSSLTNRSLEIKSSSVAEESAINDAQELVVSDQANSKKGSTGVESPEESRSYLDSVNPGDASFPSEGNGGGDSGLAAEQDKLIKSQSFHNGAFINEERPAKELPELGSSSSSIFKDRGEKRALGDEGRTETTKKLKEWLSVDQDYEHFQLPDSKENWPGSQEGSAPSVGILNESIAHGSSTSSLLSRSCGEPSMQYTREKNFMLSSFKICDLNLMQSDINENDGRFLLYPSAANKKVPVDVDLSISNNCGLLRASSGKEIDLASNSLHTDGNSNSSAMQIQDELSVERFQNNDQILHDPHAQDGYGLMMSDLIGSDIPNGSSVQPELNSLNSLHNEMSLLHEEDIMVSSDWLHQMLPSVPEFEFEFGKNGDGG